MARKIAVSRNGGPDIDSSSRSDVVDDAGRVENIPNNRDLDTWMAECNMQFVFELRILRWIHIFIPTELFS